MYYYRTLVEATVGGRARPAEDAVATGDVEVVEVMYRPFLYGLILNARRPRTLVTLTLYSESTTYILARMRYRNDRGPTRRESRYPSYVVVLVTTRAKHAR